MIFSMPLFVKFLIGIVKRFRSDPYYRSLGVLTAIVLLIATLFVWLVGGWPLLDALLYAVSTMSMNTPFGPLSAAAGPELKAFHLVYTFISVGVFITFTLETGKTMLATYEETLKKLAERRAKKVTG